MKKTISLLLVVILAFSLSVTALAAGPITGDETSKDVGATYTEGSRYSAGTIYGIDLEWTPISNLSYKDNSVKYTWNAETHKYVASTDSDASWSTTSIEIKVTNHSNVGITATADYVDANGGPVTTAEWGTKSVTCGSAAEGIEFTDTTATGSATSGTISGTVKVTSGTISASTAKVGTVSITLGQVS